MKTSFCKTLFKTVFLSTLLIFAVTSCNTTKNAAADYIEVVFGQGGGVTGAVEEYHLSRDGSIRKGDQVVKKLSKSERNKVNRAFGKINFNNVAMDDPSNIYYFLGYRNALKEQRLVWNDQTHTPLEVLKAYDVLMKMVK
jgi:hypothetical protein